MIRRDSEIEQFGEVLDTLSISVLNIYGEAGIGKTAFVHQLMNGPEFVSRMAGGYIDLGRFSTSSDSEMIDELYELCDQLKAISSFKPMDFRIADTVDSKRSKRIPYSEREAAASGSGEMMDVALDVSDIATQFIDLTYLGTGLKAWKVLSKVYQKYKPVSQSEKERYQYYDDMDDQKLRESLPVALAEDIKLSEAKGCRRIVMFVDNFNHESTEIDDTKNDWLNRLIERSAERVLWVLISRKPLESGIKEMARLELSGIGDDQMRDYLKPLVNQADTAERIIKLCAGSPFYMHRILEIIHEKGDFSDKDWERLASKERLYIAREYLNHLSMEKREVLFMLSYASVFDRHIFHILFPERIFGLNDTWFKGATFESTVNGVYSVQSSMADVIHTYLKELNPQIESECYNRLFDAERLLIKHTAAAGDLDLHSHFCCLCHYGRKTGNPKKFYNILNELKSLILSGGDAKQYYCELKYLLDCCDETSDIRLKVLSDITLMDYYQSNYMKAVRRCEMGRTLAEKYGNSAAMLQFIAIQMDIAHIAPSCTDGAADQVITLANEYIELLETLRTSISYKAYVTNKINAHLYIAREYTIKENFKEALAYMKYIFEVLNDVRKVNALSLYDIYARSHEIMGNIYGEMRRHELEEEMQQKAVESYNIAEAVQTAWDPEFYLNFGLACKRHGESCLRQGRLDEGIEYIESALSKYRLVKNKNHEITDTYCKIGFACNDAAKYLIEYPQYDGKTREFLQLAEDTANEAIMQIEDITGEKSNGNRQLCNIRCTASRLSGVLFAKNGRVADAEAAFKKSLECGLRSIEAAPSHPYGHYGHAWACYDYAVFLIQRNRSEEAERIAAEGIADIAHAREYTDDPNAFHDLYQKLSEEITPLHQS